MGPRRRGRSPRPTEQYSSIEDLASVARSVSDSPATLIGCSFGGLVTAHCALDHPELVAALVLVGPVIGGLAHSEHFGTRAGAGSPQVLAVMRFARWRPRCANGGYHMA